LQGSLYEGIYLIKNGEIKISTYSKLSDLTKLMFGLIWSFKGFKEHVPPSEFKNLIKDKNNDNNNSINESNIPLEEENKEIDFGSLKEGDILGLNELYDCNNSLFNFTAECISKEACLFYINKNNFNLILSKENTLYDSVIQKVELRIKYMIGTIKNYKRFFSKINTSKPKKENLKIGINHAFDTKQLKGKNLKQNFNTSSWNKSKEKSSFNLMKRNISSDKKYSRNNNNAILMNNINCYMPSLREKLFQTPSTLKSQDKAIFHQIFEKNNRICNFNNNLLNSKAFNFLTIKEPHYENNEEDNKLLKSITYKNLNKSSNVHNYKIYNFTTPNNLKGKNRSNLIYENANENSKDKLPFLFKERTKRINRQKNNSNYTHILYHG
jgi:CRP-like cAMP-binding protein